MHSLFFFLYLNTFQLKSKMLGTSIYFFLYVRMSDVVSNAGMCATEKGVKCFDDKLEEEEKCTKINSNIIDISFILIHQTHS